MVRSHRSLAKRKPASDAPLKVGGVISILELVVMTDREQGSERVFLIPRIQHGVRECYVSWIVDQREVGKISRDIECGCPSCLKYLGLTLVEVLEDISPLVQFGHRRIMSLEAARTLLKTPTVRQVEGYDI